MMRNWSGFSAVLGITLLVFGTTVALGVVLFGVFAGLSFQFALQWFVGGHLLLGLVFLLLWFFSRGQSLGDAAPATRGRALRFGANALSYSLVFGGLLIAANLLALRFDRRIDLTEQKIYSLSDETRNVLAGLAKPVHVVVVDLPDQLVKSEARTLLGYYKAARRDLFSYELLDPRREPRRVEQLQLRKGNLVHIEYGSDSEAQIIRLNTFNEELLTNALMKLSRGKARKIYYVEGHDEPSLSSESPDGFKLLGLAIEDEHFQMESILLAQSGVVPEDAAALILAAPEKPLLTQERAIIGAYVESGGNLLLLHDPLGSRDIAEIAADYGIEVAFDVVLDQVQRLQEGPEQGWQIVAKDYDALHPVTKRFAGQGQKVSVFQIASSVGAIGKDNDAEHYTELVRSGISSWAETDLEQLFGPEAFAQLDPQHERVGPLPLAVAYERKEDLSAHKKPAKVAVYGDVDWVRNINLHYFANRDLILNTINWLTDVSGGISIRPRTLRHSLVPLDQRQIHYALALGLLLPELLLVAGLYVWWRRKTRQAA